MAETSLYDTAGWMRRAQEAERQLEFLQALYGKTNLWKGECGHVWPVEADVGRPNCPICTAQAERDRAVFALDESRRAHHATLMLLEAEKIEADHQRRCAVEWFDRMRDAQGLPRVVGEIINRA